MDVEVTLKNYRCFPENYPARILVTPGFSAFLGANNSGKSSMLRFFYEFRNLFQQLQNPNFLMALLRGQGMQVSLQDVADTLEVFSRGNDHDIDLSLCITPGATIYDLNRSQYRLHEIYSG